MRFFVRPIHLLLIAALIALICAFAALHHFRWLERASFNVERWLGGPFPGAIDLDSYQVDIEAQVVEGLDDDISALTFDPSRKTLFTVTNQRSELIELSLQGNILRRIALVGFGDPEAVEYISPGVYVITDERQQRLIKINIDDSTQIIDAQDAEQLSLNFGGRSNKGFEGLAYDSAGKRLFVARERDPMLIYEVQGFPRGVSDKPLDVQVTQDRRRDAGLFVRDLSSLQYDERSGHLLALSDESLLVLELDVQGRPLSTMSLRKGRQGLSKSVPQPEGIAMDDDGNLYMVSEPNLFYVFRKR
ncbi:SdiA-regulated domain-containing protein [Pseudomonas rhizosphaerae]|jgi:uncharacterized protein YjiK|uniref:DNA-binding protein n=1 Tax=Pseudomonas rhizosphaerae TaxID=216142 RepID=A0A089YTX7_9PSED|nr:SdiA-regulated domain-containing protein [Pseudomonas rhizosphaerae]AIS19069.1 DNA-binding protein [Pseudomonas rhizosphaerae]MEB2870768.1 SdiA-regulated domain-containing protein [Pseudomonas rhizosphaerae]